MKKIIYLISFLVLVLVIFLNNLPQSKTIPNFVKILPKFNAILNFICFILLIISLISIKKRKIYTHKLINGPYSQIAVVLDKIFYKIFQKKYNAYNKRCPLFYYVSCLLI